MEKYRQFADGKTGVNPFVPVWSHYRQSHIVFVVAKFIFVVIPLFPFRLALFVLSLMYLSIVSCLSSIISFSILQCFLNVFFLPLGCKLCMWSLGVFSSSYFEEADYRRLQISKSASDKGVPVWWRLGFNGSFFRPLGNTNLIISNHQSFIDVLYYGHFGINSFSFGNQKSVCLIRAILVDSWKIPKSKPQSDAKNTSSEYIIPTVVFPEGARTNGSCILKWEKDALGVANHGTLFALEYSKSNSYTCHHTTGSNLLLHVARLFCVCDSYQSVKGVWLDWSEVKSVKRDEADPSAKMRTLLTRMLPQAVEVSCDRSTMVNFIEYWCKNERKQK